MATFKLNLARIKGCPPPQEVADRMEKFGLPKNEEFGVLNHSATSETAFATIVHRTIQPIQIIDEETQEITTTSVEKATTYPFAVRPAKELLEIYGGPASGIELIGVFFASFLALPTVVQPIELDIPSAIDKLVKRTSKFQLRSVRVSDYAHSSYMAGPYAPKFLDTQHGRDFMGEYADYVLAANVRFQGDCGRVNVTLTPKACFSYSCQDDDQSAVQQILRGLVQKVTP